MTLTDLTDTETVLLAKLLAKDAKGIKLAPGHYSVGKFSITCDGGSISVGDPVEYTPTVSVPLLATLTIALHRAGFQREGIASLIVDAASTAIGNGDKVGDELATTIAYVEREVKELQARLASDLPKKTRGGPTRVKAR